MTPEDIELVNNLISSQIQIFEQKKHDEERKAEYYHDKQWICFFLGVTITALVCLFILGLTGVIP
jgi:hypothetical protein